MTKPLAVLAAGGTGGHMFPAQSLADELLRRGWRVALATDRRGETYASGFAPEVERRALRAATPARGGIRGKIAAPVSLIAGTIDAIRWFRSARPDIVVGFGGYPAAPATAAAIRLGIPRILHEQNAVLGKANRLFVKRVDLLACGIGIPANTPPGVKTVEVGIPIRDAAIVYLGAPFDSIKADMPINIVAFGGSQGSKALSDIVPLALAKLSQDHRSRLHVTLQARDEQLSQTTEVLAKAGIQTDVAAFFDDMPKRIAEAHLVISRSGASTCAELSAIGRPSILVPLPTAMADHQTANARALETAGGAVLMPESSLSVEGLSSQIAALVDDPDRLTAMALAAASIARPHATTELADLVEQSAGHGL